VRVLAVIHDYLPLHAAGSEIYTANLCRALADAGHDVAVFTCEERRDLEQWSLTEREHDGIPVFEAIYNRIYDDLAEQWDDPKMGEVFDGVLERWKPDLVHVQGLQFVGGVSALKAVAARDIPVVMTLHEYWWLCPRAGLMYDLDGRACETATPTDCARCVDIYPIDRERWSDEATDNAHAELGTRRWFARALDGRAAELGAARELVDRFIAPSAFLLERFAGAGFPRERLVHADYGFPPAVPVARPIRDADAPLHVGFVGTLSDYKGAEVFARAVAAVGASPERLAASIHGHTEWFPEISARLQQVADGCPALTLAGPFGADRKDAVWSALDLLVVPSLWWENSPLTIHEAWQRGVPVLASELGGMAELVAQGGGATFPPGDADALAAQLAALLDDPAPLESWRASIPPVRLIAEDVALLESLAAELGRS
jgi:glycosyltransferase involved in cell wall biosynthesis